MDDLFQSTAHTLQEDDNQQEIVNDDGCSCLCCTNFESAHQPTTSELYKSSSVSGWSIQTSWYAKHTWVKLLECVQYLARQGLPLRGHHEDSASFEGYHYQLFLLQAKSCPQLGSWLKQQMYISPETVNELITICGQKILQQLLQGITAADRFAVTADEATDISHNEQMCIAIRWVRLSIRDTRSCSWVDSVAWHQGCDIIHYYQRCFCEVFPTSVKLSRPGVRWCSYDEWCL